MLKNKTVKCPICNSQKANSLLDFNSGNFDGSTLYSSIKIRACERCGHVYNRLSSEEIAGLMKYYNGEYIFAHLAHMGSKNNTGNKLDGYGGNFRTQYDNLYSFISPYINNDSEILDVGCATGDFLEYLHEKGLKKIHGVASAHGIDVGRKYINRVKKNIFYDLRAGSAMVIPHKDNSINLLVLDQVLEHLVDPRKAFKEAKRVLVNEGLLCIGVPDASRYGKKSFFVFFWFLIREHIQHFDIEHLKLIAEQEGFELVNFNKNESPMTSEKMILPTLNIIFRLANVEKKINKTKHCLTLKKTIEAYVSRDLKKLNQKRKLIAILAASKRSVYVWGIGREFLYLYESAKLKKCNIVGLIDLNPDKQKTFLINGQKIMSQSVLKKATKDSVLIISAVAHANFIKAEALRMGYPGKIIEF